ncbi:hypothetical protein GALMADRAFT_239812 [Galerina marginata CBS 339.88]|uniref:Chromo domain-containing protein n=1 Tax=Galerina marginata (strain CBS 339.88) TaxID=685588 RepID=A0A067TRT1_GALM3|nr:hypothetical protein GALMADRAFT_239812 [Galerina marginata CBS 339.88]
MSDNEEYEVESIREARVEAASRAKKAKLVWKYLVRWKGYTPDDDTWEPIDSFVGSENMVQAFWERAQTNGRDVDDLSMFKAGETFRPVGPPKRQKRKLITKDAPKTQSPQRSPEGVSSMSAANTKSLDKRRHVSEEATESSQRPLKRPREEDARDSLSTNQRTEFSSENAKRTGKAKVSFTPTSLRQKQRRSPSPEVIPDSDEEMNGSTVLHYLSPSKPPVHFPVDAPIMEQFPPTTHNRPSTTLDDPGMNALVDGKSSSRIPAHRARMENPLVKMVDFSDPGVLAGAIATKAYAIDRANDVPSSSKSSNTARRPRPGPGRSSSGLMIKPTEPKQKSSLLTSQKGSLKSVKGKYSKQKDELNDRSASVDNMDTQVETAIPEPPPTAEELLQLAGLDPQVADALPDFEDSPAEGDQKQAIPPLNPTNKTSSPKEDRSTSQKESLAHLTDNLFHGNRHMDSLITPSASFTRPTIFGPLTMGSDSTAPLDQYKPKNRSQSSRLFLNLDASVSIPALLTAPSPPDYFNSKIGIRGTPGKFYRTEAALTLLSTVRSSGASAVVIIDGEATAEEKDHFTRFSARLEEGDLFVAVAGTQILMFCSTSNTLLAHRLNAPPALLNQPSKILVSQVDIENYSGYADAAADADNRQWSRIIPAI